MDMGLLNFSSGKKDKERSHLKNLLVVAMADGKVEFSEARLLLRLAKRLGLDSKSVIAIKNNDQISDEEVKVCKTLALKLNLLPKVVDDLIEFRKKNFRKSKRAAQAS